MRPLAHLTAAFLLIGSSAAAALDTSAGEIRVSRIIDGLNEPWSFAFGPTGNVWVTERGGRLSMYLAEESYERAVDFSGLPDIAVGGQGGLFDILLPRDFGQTGEILISYAAPQRRGLGTAVASARVDYDQDRLTDLRVLWEMPEGTSGGRHFGGRLVEGADGHIFLTLGDRGEAPQSQNLAAPNGKVIRINRDGSIPADTPFPDASVPGIWSFGHRNPQGAALDLDGQLWLSEHGAAGGDEVNRVQPGRNYGWPVISYGVNYNGSQIGEGTAKEGMEQPTHYWDPSIAPSGHMIYSGALWPEWRGDHFVGSLKFDYIARLDPDAGWAEEALRSRETGRVRDIREGPDGAIWFLSVERGALFSMYPE